MVRLLLIESKINLIFFFFNFLKQIYYREQNYKIREIAEITNITKSKVGRICKRYKNNQDLGRKAGSGRPSLMNSKDIKAIKKFTKIIQEFLLLN